MIYETDFQKQIENAFLTYGASVAQERAIPDVRDMLKIGLRQGLYAQFTNKLTHKDKMQKAQKSVAAAMNQSYVHGDVAMYDTFIRAARPWSYRYPIEDVQGSFGNPSSPDSHAAARYVEMRAGEVADYFFSGLKKNAIGEQWYSNYDDTEMIPSVLPSIGFWNIVNGCSGIAVAMATSVPQFNLREVNEALIKIIQNPDVSFDEIYCAPDFATGGTIINAKAVRESLKNGKGESIRIKAKLEYFPDQNMIQATELPYGVFTNTIIEQLAAITNENESYGIERVVDHTKKTADIRIYLSKGVNPKRMIAKLYKDTSLENWYAINMILLDMGRFPKVFGWREACDAYINHIRECERHIIQFDLDKALARLNIIEGLLIAVANIDEVVAIIRSSQSPDEASSKLIVRFHFNEEQAKAILAMRLSALTKIDAIKLQNEQEEIKQKIEYLQHLLNESTALDAELIKILREVANKFGDTRRTKVIDIIEEEEMSVSVEEKDVMILLFDNNTLRIIEKDESLNGKRGRKGTNLKPPKGSNLINTLYTTNLGTIAAITSSGKLYNMSITNCDIDTDYSIYELCNINAMEKVLLLTDTTSLNSYQTLITVSKHGYIKRSATSEYNLARKKGVAAVKLEDNDILVSVFLSSNENDKIMILGNNGYYNYYPINLISCTGRMTKGVKCIKSDNVVGATLIKNDISYLGLLTIAEDGHGKITNLNEFSITSRAVKGNQAMNNQCVAIYAITDTCEKIFLSCNNKALVLNIKDIPIQSRLTSGVKLVSSTPVEIMQW